MKRATTRRRPIVSGLRSLRPMVWLCPKGPFCNPDFPSKDHEKKQEQKTKLYQAFVRDPSEVWQRFCNRNRKRRQYNRERHPLYCAPGDTDPNLAFEDLEPSRHLAPASPALPGIH